MSNTRAYDFINGPETSTLPGGGFTPGVEITGTRAAPQSIAAATGITINDEPIEVIFVQGSGGPIDITANPQIEAATITGYQLILIGRDNTNTVKLDHGTGLSLNGPFYLKEDCIISLIWDGTNWNELYRREG